jgi:hypothetical protein
MCRPVFCSFTSLPVGNILCETMNVETITFIKQIDFSLKVSQILEFSNSEND